MGICLVSICHPVSGLWPAWCCLYHQFTTICLHTLYDPLLGCNSFWGYFHIYILYIIYFFSASASLLTCVFTSLTTSFCLNLPFSFCMHWNTYLHSQFLNISYRFCLNVFCCFLIVGQIFTVHVKYSKIYNQHYICAIFDKTFSVLCFSS